MSDDDGSSSGRSSISVDSETKARFDTFRRQLSVHKDRDVTGDGTLAYLLDRFEEEHDWADTGSSDNS